MPEGETVLKKGGVGAQSACDFRLEPIVPKQKDCSFTPQGNKWYRRARTYDPLKRAPDKQSFQVTNNDKIALLVSTRTRMQDKVRD